MVIPNPQLQPESQPWARSVDERVARLIAENEELRRTIEKNVYVPANYTPTFDDIYYQIARIYTLIGSSTVAPPVVAPPPVATYSVETRTADWSRTWGSSSYYTGTGTYTDGNALYQGQSPENKVGMWHFPISSARGKKITAAQMFIQNINSPWRAGFVAGFGTHGNAAAPVGKPSRANGFDVSWTRGEGKWINIPSWAWAGLSNGSITGFTIGDIGPSNDNSAYFQGVGKATPPKIEITYQN